VSTPALYLYCFAKCDAAPPLARAPKGLPGAKKPRAIDAGAGLWAIAAEAPLDRYGEARIAEGLKDLDWVSACAIGHEAVVEFVARSAAVVPAKLFTIFLGETRLVSHAAAERARLRKIFRRVEGCEEFGVRVSLDERAALRAAESRARRAAKPASGAAFLARKRALRDTAREITVEARETVDDWHAALARAAREARRRAPVQQASGPRLLLDAAFLVRTEKNGAFRKAVERVRRGLGPGYDLVLTGPWPPYNFVSEA